MDETRRKVMDAALYAGEILLVNGAEIARVQDTLGHILRSFEEREHSVYVLSNTMIVTLRAAGEEDVTSMRYIPQVGMHLGRVDAVNRLSRALARNPREYTPDTVMERLRECAAMPACGAWQQLLACAVAGAAFCYMLGGSPADSAAALVAGFVLRAYQLIPRRNKGSAYVSVVVCAALVTLVSLLLVRAGLGDSLNHTTIGAIISLVPGVAITTSIRDFFSGDYLSGGIHLIDALLTAVCLAVGVGTVLGLGSYVFGGVPL